MESKNKNLLIKYQYALTKLKEIGNKYEGLGYFPDKDVPFFEEKGCEVENYDFGVETFEIKKVSKKPIRRGC